MNLVIAFVLKICLLCSNLFCNLHCDVVKYIENMCFNMLFLFFSELRPVSFTVHMLTHVWLVLDKREGGLI